jgi:hypothetical protein
MNVLKFRGPKPEPAPRVKTKRTPRLRVVKTDRDVCIPKPVFESGVSRFLA